MNLVASKVDKSELEAKIASMRILENIDLPASIQSLLPPKPVKEKVKKAPKVAAKGDDVVEEEAVEEEEAVVPQKPAATVRMANLCVIAGHKVNGVAAIHSQIVIDEVFNDFYKVCTISSYSESQASSSRCLRLWILRCAALARKVPEQDQWRYPKTVAIILQP